MDGSLGFDAASAPCGWLAFSDGGSIVHINGELLRMLDREGEALAGQHVEVILTGASRLYFHVQMAPALARDGRMEQLSLTLARRDGAAVPVLVNAVRRPRPDGALTELVVLPLGERTALEDGLLRVRKAAEMVPGAIFQLLARPDGTMCVPYASAGLKAVCGLLPGQVYDSADLLIATVHPADRSRWLENLQRSAGALATFRDTSRIVLPDGCERWVESHATPEALPGGGVLWHGYLFDVTERLALEDARRDKAAAEQASVGKTEFLQAMSHELRTPLNAVLGLTEALDESVYGALSERQRAAVARIRDSGQHLLALINDVLDLAKVEAGRVELDLQAVDVNEICQASVRLVEGAAERRRIDLGWSAAPGLPAFTGDPRRLKQVLVNLLGNAIKFSREGGRVRLLAARGADPDTIDLSVVDHGIGIAPADQGRLFQPFVQLDGGLARAHAGTGLGLSLVKQIVSMHGGAVRVDSAVGAGSRFTVTLPLRPVEAGEPPRTSDTQGPARPRLGF